LEVVLTLSFLRVTSWKVTCDFHVFNFMHGAVECPVKFEISKVRKKILDINLPVVIINILISTLFESYHFENVTLFSMKTECRKDVHNALHQCFS